MKLFKSAQGMINSEQLARELETNPDFRAKLRSIFMNPEGFVQSLPPQLTQIPEVLSQVMRETFYVYFEAWLLYDPELEKMTESEAQNIASVISHHDFIALQHRAKDLKGDFEKRKPKKKEENVVKLPSPSESAQLMKELEPGKRDSSRYMDHVLDLFGKGQITKEQMQQMLTEAKVNINMSKVAQHLENVEKLETLDEREMARAIRDAIMAEQDAVKQYETIVDSVDNALVKEVLQAIADEEKVHTGELQELLRRLLKDEQELLDDGAEEVRVSSSDNLLKTADKWDIQFDIMKYADEDTKKAILAVDDTYGDIESLNVKSALDKMHRFQLAAVLAELRYGLSKKLRAS